MKTEIKNFSLIIPTFNRSEYLEKLLYFLERAEERFPIYVLDSSSKDIEAVENQKICKRYDWVHYQKFPSDIVAFEKILSVCRELKTQYVSVCPDDDLIVTSHIPEMISILEKDLSCTVVQGKNILAEQFESKVNLSWLYVTESLDDENYEARLLRFFSNYEANCYGVFRTSQYADYLSHSLKPDSQLYRELAMCVLPVLEGKCIRIAKITQIRNSEPVGSRRYETLPMQIHTHMPYRAHPVDWSLCDLQGLVRSYQDYVNLIWPWMEKKNLLAGKTRFLRQLFDFAHLNYILSSFTPKRTIEPKMLEACKTLISEASETQKPLHDLKLPLKNMPIQNRDKNPLKSYILKGSTKNCRLNFVSQAGYADLDELNALSRILAVDYYCREPLRIGTDQFSSQLSIQILNTGRFLLGILKDLARPVYRLLLS